MLITLTSISDSYIILISKRPSFLNFLILKDNVEHATYNYFQYNFDLLLLQMINYNYLCLSLDNSFHFTNACYYTLSEYYKPIVYSKDYLIINLKKFSSSEVDIYSFLEG